MQGTTTLKNRQGLGHFTIVHMWDKGARNTFLHHVKNDPHKLKGSTIVGENNRFTTIFDDHVVCKPREKQSLQWIQRHTRSARKRGGKSTVATTQRQANAATKRSQHLRWYRWCKSNVGYFEEDLDRRRPGNGTLTCFRATAAQSLKKTRSTGLFAYEDQTVNRKRSPHFSKLSYGTALTVATLNACSLWKISTHHQLAACLRNLICV